MQLSLVQGACEEDGRSASSVLPQLKPVAAISSIQLLLIALSRDGDFILVPILSVFVRCILYTVICGKSLKLPFK